MRTIRGIGEFLVFVLIFLLIVIGIPLLIFFLLTLLFPRLYYAIFGLIPLLLLIGTGIFFFLRSLKKGSWLDRLIDRLEEWVNKEKKDSESEVVYSHFEEINDGKRKSQAGRKGKIGYILIAILGVGLFLWASFSLRSCGSSKETKPDHPIKEVSDFASSDKEVPITLLSVPFDSTKPVTKDSFALVWNREVEVLIPPNHFFRFDFDQAETLRVRLRDGQTFEKTHDQWFLQGSLVLGLPSEIPGLSVFLSSKKDMDVTFSKRPK